MKWKDKYGDWWNIYSTWSNYIRGHDPIIPEDRYGGTFWKYQERSLFWQILTCDCRARKRAMGHLRNKQILTKSNQIGRKSEQWRNKWQKPNWTSWMVYRRQVAQHREQMLLIFQLFAQPRPAPEYQDMHFCSNLTMAVKWYTIINGPAQSTPAKKKGSPFAENYLHLLRIRWAIWQNIAFMKEYDM